jgi:dTDP-4-dehydrorhamnose reductase
MKILILGASGFLGSILHKILSSDHDVIGTTTSTRPTNTGFLAFNYTDRESIHQLLEQIEPDYVVNCIALADVDLAETDEMLASKLNFELPHDLSSLCETNGIRLIHISTDHFESAVSGLLESDIPVPVNIYGKTKLLGDLAVLKNSKSAVVVRTNFFGRSVSGEKGLIDFVDGSLRSSKSIHGYQNIVFNPVGAHFLGGCIHKLVHSNFSGVLNIGSPELISKFQFLCLIASKLNLDPARISPLNYISSGGLADRPKCMALNTSECKKFLGIDLPTIQTQLDMELSGTLPSLEIEES